MGRKLTKVVDLNFDWSKNQPIRLDTDFILVLLDLYSKIVLEKVFKI